MRYVITAAAALAVSGLLATTAARAEPLFEAGGPVKIGNLCSVSTDNDNNGAYGYMEPCAQPQKAARVIKKKRTRS